MMQRTSPMIPESLFLKTPLPEKVNGQILVRLRNGDFVIVSGKCPRCILGPRARQIMGWMFLHEQSAREMDLTLAKPSTQILKNHDPDQESS